MKIWDIFALSKLNMYIKQKPNNKFRHHKKTFTSLFINCTHANNSQNTHFLCANSNNNKIEFTHFYYLLYTIQSAFIPTKWCTAASVIECEGSLPRLSIFLGKRSRAKRILPPTPAPHPPNRILIANGWSFLMRIVDLAK